MFVCLETCFQAGHELTRSVGETIERARRRFARQVIGARRKEDERDGEPDQRTERDLEARDPTAAAMGLA